MYECFECGYRTVIWDNDFDYQDYGLDGDGIVHICHCQNCGAQIMYFCPNDKEEGEKNEEST